MNFLFIAFNIMFCIPLIGLLSGGGKLFELRNYHYAVIGLSIIIYFLFKINIIKNKKNFFSEPSKRVYFSLIILSFVSYICDSLSRYYGFKISGIDFSIFEGLLQNAINGHWGYEDITQIYHFGIHQNWVLFLVLPFYYIIPHPLLLVILSSIILWIPGIQIIKIAKQLGYESSIAYLSSICWWTCGFTVQALHGNFYPEFFYPLFLFAILTSYLDKKNIPLIIYAFLFLSVKEDAIIYIIGFSIAIAFKIIINKVKNNQTEISFYMPLFLILLSIFFGFINFGIVKPYFLRLSNIQEVGYIGWWRQWGSSPFEILINLINNPIIFAKNLFYSSGWKILYIPMLFIPLFNLEVLFASLPIIVLYGVSQGNPSEYSLYYPLAIWAFALYGLLKNQVVPKKILIIILLLLPLWKPSWLGIEKINWDEWKILNNYKITMDSSKNYCIHEGLFPYLVNLEIKAFPFLDAHKISCIPVFSIHSSSFPNSQKELYNLYISLKKDACIENQIGGIIEIKNSNICLNAIKF
ncbi:DUF2079 domain-containing protein [Silvanigrella aquatica]|uniref:DUF2079 domain-containing protein n=1 Tax=Silvanigrella aquatica TaxID=1915309 RepID=A0A1L4D1Z5_9BACT|nr:DUF2079 domain-containing protein [Silvanigrella aquatica]APJ04235.1 hypothetical protein AXG55_10080 [Silvanigrella aquatica]